MPISNRRGCCTSRQNSGLQFRATFIVGCPQQRYCDRWADRLRLLNIAVSKNLADPFLILQSNRCTNKMKRIAYNEPNSVVRSSSPGKLATFLDNGLTKPCDGFNRVRL